MSNQLEQLRRPFHPNDVTFKPSSVRRDGTAAMGLAYVGLRAYMDRLDECWGTRWDVEYKPWGEGRIICTISITGDDFIVSRSSTGETSGESERNEIGGTVAEAQAFKRACAMLGLGRYLYTLPQVWAEWHVDDPSNVKKGHFTPTGIAQLRRAVLEHYTEATGEQVAHEEAARAMPERPAQSRDEQFMGDDGFTPFDPSATGDIVAWAQWLNSGPAASEKQLQYLFKQIEYAIRGAQGFDVLRRLIGDAMPSRTLASTLIDAISKTTYDRDLGKGVPNPKFDQAKLDALTTLVQGG